jgi:hypothetical protein
MANKEMNIMKIINLKAIYGICWEFEFSNTSKIPWVKLIFLSGMYWTIFHMKNIL